MKHDIYFYTTILSSIATVVFLGEGVWTYVIEDYMIACLSCFMAGVLVMATGLFWEMKKK